ncbi:MAG: T9SS type A sorting domain-containing protein [Flavobacteriales bacterium]|nr:T9SS type A sorting domain-containing protein [Flavobacteriales bacterium]MCX7769353.1 T9SS type A sorting domain-containing protein [Flavobacteriales bacterium]MDW8410716.1 T9SS type A sorting domain-containing protein [Flavobacteriales bacterium]
MKKIFLITLVLAFTVPFVSAGPAKAFLTNQPLHTPQSKERAIPAHGHIYISSKYALELIEVYDEQGNLYEKIPLKATQFYTLNINKWPLGIYTIKVTNNISSVKRKILKVR